MTASTRKRLLILAVVAAGAIVALQTLTISQPWRDTAVRAGVLAALLIAAGLMRRR